MKDISEMGINPLVLADFETWQNAQTEEEKDAFIARCNARYNEMSEEQKSAFQGMCKDAVKRIYDDVMDDKAAEMTNQLREQLKVLTPALSLGYIAKTYFGKSSAWLYQRLNGNVVNGKAVHFTCEEIKIFKATLADLGARLSAASA